MNRRPIVSALCAAVVCAAVAVRAQSGSAGSCPHDSKLLNDGPTAVYGEGPGTWWGLVGGGLEAAGFGTDAEKLDYLNQVFGTTFGDLDSVKAYNLDLLSAAWDANQNGYVCAFELRGTRAYSGDPFINLTTFGVADDKVAKK